MRSPSTMTRTATAGQSTRLKRSRCLSATSPSGEKVFCGSPVLQPTTRNRTARSRAAVSSRGQCVSCAPTRLLIASTGRGRSRARPAEITPNMMCHAYAQVTAKRRRIHSDPRQSVHGDSDEQQRQVDNGGAKQRRRSLTGRPAPEPKRVDQKEPAQDEGRRQVDDARGARSWQDKRDGDQGDGVEQNLAHRSEEH